MTLFLGARFGDASEDPSLARRAHVAESHTVL
jgi:hypothetical protein